MVSHKVGTVNWRLSETGTFTEDAVRERVVEEMAWRASEIVDVDI